MPLTEIAIKAIKPGEKITRHYDERGLYLEVSPAGGKWWRFKYSYGGKEKRLSLGVYPDVSLKEARGQRDAFRVQLAAGTDPGAQRREEKVVAAGERGFESIARDWHSHWKIGKNQRYADYVITRLEQDVFPEIGDLGMQQITAKVVVACIRKIEARGAGDLARKQMNTVGQVFRWAIANDLAERNPVADISPSDVLKPVEKRNMARVPERELPELLVKIDSYEGKIITRYALQFMALTFVRTSELIGARWEEMDGANWRIPAERMKMPTPHIVPMASQAQQLLQELRLITGQGEYLFPGERRGAMSNNTILFALYRMGYRSRMTGHGFRGLASTVLHERGWPHEHIELQLAHAERDEISAAYNHALYLEPRAKMMQWWADFLDEQRKKKPA